MVLQSAHMDSPTVPSQAALQSLLTVAEAAAFLRVSPDTLKRMVRRGEVRHLRVGVRGMRFLHGDLVEDMRPKPAQARRVAYPRPRVVL